ncbi:MAG: hypothetical protein ACRD2S_02755 [Terriglobales bacterium]
MASLTPQIAAKNKKKQLLPDEVLVARTVIVVISPDTGEPVTHPTANRTAQEVVERALMKWGRFQLVNSEPADLIIAVRKGNQGGPVISNSPADTGPVIYQPNNDGSRVGLPRGRPPDVTNPNPSASRGPQIGNEAGSSEDTFEVYRGGFEHPLDMPPVWRYMGENALDGPQVTAVEQFRKAIDKSEKQRQQKP